MIVNYILYNLQLKIKPVTMKEKSNTESFSSLKVKPICKLTHSL